MPDLPASVAPGSWVPVTNVTCGPPETNVIIPRAARYEYESEFHDREGFIVPADYKPFAIMENSLIARQL